MQDEYNRQITYKEYKVDLKLITHTKTERTPNGRSWHTLYVDSANTNYHREYQILADQYFMDEEYKAISDFKKWVDNTNSTLHTNLTELGYI